MISIIFLTISFLFIGALIIFLLIKKPRTQLSIIFCLKLICVEIWLFGTAQMFLHSDNSTLVIFWDRFVYLGVIAFPSLLLHFTTVFIGQFKKYKKIIFASYCLSILFLIISRFSIFVDDVFIYKWGVHTQAQFSHHFFLVFFLVTVIWSLATLIKYYRQQTDVVEKERTKYIIFSFFFLYFISFFAFLPAYNIPIFPIPFITGVFFTFFIVYAITRYRLMNLHIIIKRSMIYIITAVVAASILTLSTSALLSTSKVDPTHITYLYLFVVIILLLQPIHFLIKRVFLKKRYDFKLPTKRNNVIDVYLTEYFEPIYQNFRKEVQLETFYLYAFRPEETEKTFVVEFPEADERDSFEITEQNYIWLQNFKKLVTVEDIKQFHQIKNIFKVKKADALVPLVTNNVLVGFITVKVSNAQEKERTFTIIKKYQGSFSSILHMALNVKYLQRQ